ncbi:hypothetical protein JSQ81_19620 [Sporosarcina sp. Marseille-Q4063]|uniref:YczE/YyaS/YitT family protein n=1 Tax=Sporosarcina sp. Marseille-Q4063 TaxID=2810514 RepID=UPI001BAFEEB1|nr:DUF6198 family protein [Sporosarcina sp. Marseille-Q4063]QUW21949.1 hypothetical protein JSQ81_19620 [Sporosarcina sp. Marseille-Q4063]
MNHMNVTMKRLFVYIIGLFVLSLGVSFSIQAGLGVSPVSSLAYAFTLTAGLSIGMTTVIANILFIIIQAIISKQINMKEFMLQLIISFLYGFFMDATLFIIQLFPTPETLINRYIFLIISLFIISIGLLNYFTAKLPLMPYDALTFVISERFKWNFGKAKIISDLINVGIAGAVCLIFIHSFGSIGIGTLAAAYFIGKILGWMMKKYQHPLQQWVFQEKS